MNDIRIRRLEPDDYAAIIPVVDEWWGGRSMRDMLPKLFFVHFSRTSFAAECDGKIVGFLVGFLSQTLDNEAYIHFVGVHPEFRKAGLGAALYRRFFNVVAEFGRGKVGCVTSPVNKGSIAFHRALGFLPQESDVVVDGVPVVQNYDGTGGDRVVFSKVL